MCPSSEWHHPDSAIDRANAIWSATVFEERECLARLAREVPPSGLIVEIGCLYGGMTAVLCLSNPLALVCSIDNFSWEPRGPCNAEVVKANLDSLSITNHEMITGDSRVIGLTWTRPIDLLWIDGHHLEEYVRSDLTLFGVCAKVIAIHDYLEPLCPEVRPVVDALWKVDEIVATTAVIRLANHCTI